EHRKVVAARLVHVARRSLDDDAGDASQLGAERQGAAPSSRVAPGALLDDDDVAGCGAINGGSAQVPGCRGTTIVSFELHRDHSSGDAAIGGIGLQAADPPRESPL